MKAPASNFPAPGDVLFAYGTLQRGGCYHHLLERAGADFVGEAQTRQPYPLILDRYPCLLDLPEKGFPVTGELFRIPDHATWEVLDRLEDHPREYRRRQEVVRTTEAEITAWVYFFLDSSLQGTPVRRFRPA
ncbi:MAG: gamma-glutamylcyclotransferase [Verrucomicrobia bacterium]|jgi:gamma-glutamylcyclotransferase (GGCT)/AIG2-like uncharacterized protein YtfP|nr:gamma-glutamylcyclotransferase [Verrucomicrobiota bacterium]